MKKKIIIAATLITTITGVWLFSKNSETSENDPLVSEVKKGDFDIFVSTSGEIKAKNSIQIFGPSTQALRIYQLKIEHIIEEGTFVKKGDYIVQLDKSEIASKIGETLDQLDKMESKLNSTKLDTALTLRASRNELVNLKYAEEEQKLVVEQSTYEPPAVQRQTQISFEKAQRTLKQAIENYQLKEKQSISKVNEVEASKRIEQKKHERLMESMQNFTILAPENGMFLYKKDWNGEKKKAGSTIQAWDPVVGTLPDLSTMLSKTYINEIDISKIQKNQLVDIQIDAFPEKTYTGKIISVANIGQELPNSDAKVFEVEIEFEKSDSILRPAMSTSNKIVIDRFKDVLSIPLEALFSEEKTSFVYLKEGGSVVKQQVQLGAANEDYIIIEKGVEKGQKLQLTPPDNNKSLTINKL